MTVWAEALCCDFTVAAPGQLPGPYPNHLTQDLWEWGPSICITESTAGDCGVQPGTLCREQILGQGPQLGHLPHAQE